MYFIPVPQRTSYRMNKNNSSRGGNRECPDYVVPTPKKCWWISFGIHLAWIATMLLYSALVKDWPSMEVLPNKALSSILQRTLRLRCNARAQNGCLEGNPAVLQGGKGSEDPRTRISGHSYWSNSADDHQAGRVIYDYFNLSDGKLERDNIDP